MNDASSTPTTHASANTPASTPPAPTLYGRETQLRQLVDALARVRAHGVAELVLIYGAAGSGKSALAEALVHAGGPARHAAGKSDLQHHDIPYASLAQALQALTRQALEAAPAEREALRLAWLDALRGQARAVAEIVPEIHHVLGPTTPLPDVSADLAQRRALNAVLATLAAFSGHAKPLVLLLDDIQWADSATLAFLQAFIAAPPRHVLVIATCRVAGKTGVAPGLAWLDHAHRSHALPISRITLAPLDEAALCAMTGAHLHTPPARIAALCKGLHRVTHGNPLFAQQMLRALREDDILRCVEGAWTWDEQALNDACPDSVTELMARRFSHLPGAGTTLMGHLACLGMRASTSLLALVAGSDEAAVAADLAPLVQAGLLKPSGRGYAFLHDRVLEAAYATIPPAERPARHAHIAEVMIHLYGDRLDEHAFGICNQIDHTAGHPLTARQRLGYARALVVAGRRARNAGAPAQATRHADAAHALIQPDWWRRHEQLAYDASLLRCECLMAQADLARAEREINALLARRLPTLRRAAVYRLKAELLTVQSDYESAIATALAGLDMLDIRLQRAPAPAALREACEAVERARGDRDIASLAGLAPTDDARVQAAMGLLSTLVASLFVKDGLSFLHLAKMVELTLSHGVTPQSPYGLAWYGVFIASLYERYEDGLAYGLAAKDLVDRQGYEAQRLATLVAVDQVSPWTRPLWFALDHVRQAVRQGHASGDLGMACYAANHIVSDLLAMGEDLRLVEEQIELGLALTRLVRYRDVELILLAQRRFVHRLRGVDADGQADLPLADRLAQSRSMPTRFFIALYDGMAHAYLGAWDAAKASLLVANALDDAAPAHINVADCKFFLALALARTPAEDGNDAARIAAIAGLRAPFERWTALNPLTFRARLLLIDAELARLRDEGLSALALYEQAIEAARTAGFAHDLALAHELAARLCDDHGLRTAAAEHLRAAEAGYRDLDGEHKAEQLARAHRSAPPPAGGRPAAADRENAAAWATGLKAAQALSGEVVMERLLESLMTNIVSYAGAEYGLLVLMGPDGPTIEASARVLQDTVSIHLGSTTPTEHALPMTVLRSVLRTRQTLVLADATQQAPSLRDLAEPSRLLRSVLCLPLLRGGELIGVFYLENNSAPGAFDAARIGALEVLAPQLAITLQTAQLYERLIDENNRRARAELDLRNARAELARTSHLTVMGNLAASIAHEVNQPLTAIMSSVDAGVRWLKRATPDIGEALDGMAHARENAMRAAGIIRALRALAKQAPAVLEPLQADTMLQAVLETVRMDIDARGVRLRSRLQAGAASMEADQVQLQQVMLNLITNALDAMADTPLAERELEVSSAVRDDRIEIAVKDRGAGIDTESLPRIFDAFYTTKSHGLGMGLAICRSIVEAHGGILEASARRGGGTTFRFCLPLIAPPARPTAAPSAPDPRTSAPSFSASPGPGGS